MVLMRPVSLSLRNCVRNLEQAFLSVGVEEANESAHLIAAAALGKKTVGNLFIVVFI